MYNSFIILKNIYHIIFYMKNEINEIKEFDETLDEEEKKVIEKYLKRKKIVIWISLICVLALVISAIVIPIYYGIT